MPVTNRALTPGMPWRKVAAWVFFAVWLLVLAGLWWKAYEAETAMQAAHAGRNFAMASCGGLLIKIIEGSGRRRAI